MMKDMVTLTGGEYIHIQITIEHINGAQKFRFTQDYKNKNGEVYVRFSQWKEDILLWGEEVDAYDPVDAHNLLNKLLSTGYWEVTQDFRIPIDNNTQ